MSSRTGVRKLLVGSYAWRYNSHVEPNAAQCYDALLSRDRRFDGRFFTGVVTTGIYCRPICPTRPPRPTNARFFSCAAAAEAAGFRPCRRCHPEAAPGTPAWGGTSAVVSRALRLIADQALDEVSVEALAARVGIGDRHLRRLFAHHLGASPVQIARARRVHFARTLLGGTTLPITHIAFAAGFRSLRQFNHAMHGTFGRSPRELRRQSTDSSSGPSAKLRVDVCPSKGDELVKKGTAPITATVRRNGDRPCFHDAPDRLAETRSGKLVIRLSYRPPLDWMTLVGFLARRATPGVEVAADRCYRRTIEVNGKPGSIEVSHDGTAHVLIVRVNLPGCDGLLLIAERTRRLFDLGADPLVIATQLNRTPRLRRGLRAGVRVPGAWDPFELAVRAVVGQQITVRGATMLAGRLAERFGRPALELQEQGLSRLSPRPIDLADADLESVGLPRARANTVRSLARAVADGTLRLDASLGLEHAVARLCEVPGVGPWTAHYIAMRALGEPDAFPSSDLGLRKAVGGGAGAASALELERMAVAWRPWRAYAAMCLWTVGG